ARRSAPPLNDESSWHGTMTSVVACGNGRLSDGLYRGVASEARLVLVKCGTMRRIAHEDIQRGLDWVVRNRRRYGIRIVNVSFGPTVDGLQKPEVVAPGIWVSAPILPGTPTAAEASLLSRLEAVPDAEMKSVLAAHPGVDAELDAAAGLAPSLLRQRVRLKLK